WVLGTSGATGHRSAGPFPGPERRDARLERAEMGRRCTGFPGRGPPAARRNRPISCPESAKVRVSRTSWRTLHDNYPQPGSSRGLNHEIISEDPLSIVPWPCKL